MLFTGRGDGGTTSTFGRNEPRISKASDLPEALGALDELNAYLGLVKMRGDAEPYIKSTLHAVQETLFIIQAQVAGADKKVGEAVVKQIEDFVALIEKRIPPLKGFSIAGGTELSAQLDVARTLSRRTERRVVAVKEAGVRDLPAATMAYLNRLSSLLFALARFVNHRAGVVEENPSY
ncbi:MAG: pduO [Parcubacteria group bacterium]|nr:pduO [Parcubacteria group bacterium]